MTPPYYILDPPPDNQCHWLCLMCSLPLGVPCGKDCPSLSLHALFSSFAHCESMNIGGLTKTLKLTFSKRLSKHLSTTLLGKSSLSESNSNVMMLILWKALIDNECLKQLLHYELK